MVSYLLSADHVRVLVFQRGGEATEGGQESVRQSPDAAVTEASPAVASAVKGKRMSMLAEKQFDSREPGNRLHCVESKPDRLRMMQDKELFAPEAPSHVAETGIEPEILSDLLLKTAYSVASFTTEGAMKSLCLPLPIVNELLEQLRRDKLVEVLGDAGRAGYRLSITDRGRQRAVQLVEVCGYVGPAPVSLEQYWESLEWQLAHLPEVTAQEVADAISDLVLSKSTIEIAGLAGSSGRSLFLYGPPGNGKTTLSQLLHQALKGTIWVPHCIGVGSDMIVVFDPEMHRTATVDLPKEVAARVDRRWVCCQRPFVIAAGELTLEALELGHSPGRYYDAPIQVKANGGTFLIDDLGRQRVEPHQLLNRWLFPLANGVDYLTMRSGRKLRMPFRQMLIFSTNLNPDVALDGTFLRRLGYRLHIGNPAAADYADIFARYAARCEASVPPDLIAGLLDRYRVEKRPMRSCEPRDLIERARDICTYKGLPLDLSPAVMDLAWKGYFGELLELETACAGRHQFTGHTFVPAEAYGSSAALG